MRSASRSSASAADPYEPVFNTERVYAHCGDNPKVETDKSEHGGGAGWTYLWSTTPPASATAGGGCAYVGHFLGEGVTYKGTHAGNIDRLTVHVWVSFVMPDEPSFYAKLTIDGTSFPFVYSERGFCCGQLPAGPRSVAVSLTGIGLLAEDESGSRDVTLELYSGALGGSQHVWYQDAIEVPSGVTFSPTTLADTVIDVSSG